VTWMADDRALRECGLMMTRPKVRADMRARQLMGRPMFCVDASDYALDVLTAATGRGLDALIMIRVAERSFGILAQVVAAGLKQIPVPEDMTIGEYFLATANGELPSEFASLGSIAAAV
jgi:hypothetical protein